MVKNSALHFIIGVLLVAATLVIFAFLFHYGSVGVHNLMISYAPELAGNHAYKTGFWVFVLSFMLFVVLYMFTEDIVRLGSKFTAFILPNQN